MCILMHRVLNCYKFIMLKLVHVINEKVKIILNIYVMANFFQTILVKAN